MLFKSNESDESRGNGGSKSDNNRSSSRRDKRSNTVNAPSEMSLPSLVALSERPDLERDWFHACGGRVNVPTPCTWKNVSGARKMRLLHTPASKVTSEYLTPYEMQDVVELLAAGDLHSVEHVLPKSYLKGRRGVCDPLGWISANRHANSRRSNTPLVLWKTEDEEEGVEGGVVAGHYLPRDLRARARLARKWLFMRYTYECLGEVETRPSREQREHRDAILSLARNEEISPTELQMNAFYRDTIGWSNPLLDESASVRNRFYDDPGFAETIFAGGARG